MPEENIDYKYEFLSLGHSLRAIKASVEKHTGQKVREGAMISEEVERILADIFKGK